MFSHMLLQPVTNASPTRHQCEKNRFGPSSYEEEPVLMEGQDDRRVARPAQHLQHELTHIPLNSPGLCNNTLGLCYDTAGL